MGKDKGKAGGGSTLSTSGKIFLALFPFVREELRSLFALIVATLFALLAVVVASHWMSKEWVTVPFVAISVLGVLVGIGGLMYLAFEAICLWRGLFAPPPPPVLPSPLTTAERVIVQNLLDLVEGRVQGARASYLEGKLGVSRQDLIDFFTKLLQ